MNLSEAIQTGQISVFKNKIVERRYTPIGENLFQKRVNLNKLITFSKELLLRKTKPLIIKNSYNLRMY